MSLHRSRAASSEIGLALRELEVDSLARQAAVDLRVCVETVVDAATLFLIEHDLEHFAAVLTCTETLANDFDRVDKISEDRIVHGRQRARAWALLSLRRPASVATFRAWENAARCNDDDVSVGELLLKLTGEAEQEGNVRIEKQE